MSRRSILGAVALFATAGLIVPATSQAQEAWPNAPIRIVVPVAPGGTADRLSRQIGSALSASINQPVVVENISGGGGVIATQRVSTSKNDGNTFMLSYSATHSTNPAVRDVPYDPIKDFTPLAMIGGTPNVLVVGKDIPANNITEFVQLLKANPTKYSYGSAGAGTLTHLAMEQFKQATGTEMVHVPYRGGSPAMTALLGEQVQAGFPSLSTAVANIRAGLIKPIAVSSDKRHPLLPDVPTLVEAGLTKSGSIQWYGFHGPADIPPQVVAKLNQEINNIIKAAEFQKMMADGGVEAMPMTQQEFSDFVRNDKDVWTNLAKSANISVK